MNDSDVGSLFGDEEDVNEKKIKLDPFQPQKTEELKYQKIMHE